MCDNFFPKDSVAIVGGDPFPPPSIKIKKSRKSVKAFNEDCLPALFPSSFLDDLSFLADAIVKTSIDRHLYDLMYRDKI